MDVPNNLLNLIASLEASIVSEYKGPFLNLTIKCKNGHFFEKSPIQLYDKEWCEKCENKNIHLICEVLNKYGFYFNLNKKETCDLFFDIEIIGNNESIYLDIINENITNNIKIDYIESVCNRRYIAIHNNNLSNENISDVENFIIQSLLNKDGKKIHEFFFLIEKENTEENKQKEQIEQIEKIEQKKVNDKNITYVLGYTRISTNYQNDGASIDAQEEAIKKYCIDNGYQLKKMYSDPGISAKDIEHRPQLKQLLYDICPGEYLVVHSISRLSRETSDALWIRKHIEKEKKAKLVLLDYTSIEDTPDGTILFTLSSAMSQYEREKIGQRVKFTMNYKSSIGELITKPRFGWKSIGKKVPLIKDEEEQKVIQRIKELMNELQCPTVSNICRALESENYKCRKSKKWYPNRITVIIDQNHIPIFNSKKKK